MIKVRLSYDDELTAHEVGFLRAKELASTANHPSRYDRDLNYHEYISQLSEAVGSEIAVAKYFDLTDFKPTHGTFKREADVGAGLEIKWTRWRDGHLIIHQSDRMQDIAILVTDRSPIYYLKGWIPISEAKTSRTYKRSEKNWWINQADLRPMENFLRSNYATALHAKLPDMQEEALSYNH